MNTLRRAEDRYHDPRRKPGVWLTFYPRDRADTLVDGFGAIESFSENRLPPGAGVPRHPPCDAEIVTYVYQGVLAQEDSTGSSGVVQSGEFQRMTTGGLTRHKETNASPTDWAQIFRISLRLSQVGLECAREQIRFTAAQRSNVLCVVASPDGRQGSLRLHQNTLVYSSMLDSGRHLVHELLPGRSAWLHLVRGEATLQDVILTEGDGVGVTAEPSVSLTALEKTEILLVDVGGIYR